MNRSFGTPAIAHCQDFAVLAKEGQPIQLGLSEGPLRWTFEQVNQWSFPDIPEAVLHVDKVITGKEVSVMFDDRNISAGLPKDTEPMVLSEGCSDCLLEYLHFDAPDVLTQPLIKNRTEKSHRKLRQAQCGRLRCCPSG